MRTHSLLCAAAAVALVACGPEPETPPAPPQVDSATWSRDIAPLVSRTCGGCHVEGGIAPFALTRYAEAAPLAMAMKAAVEAKRMPPWMPGGATPPLRHERKLSDTEIALFARWADDGAPEGDPATAAPLPPPDAPSFATADLAFDIGADYRPDPQYTDDYRCFVVDPGVAAERMASAYRVIPGNPKTVHHVILALYSAQSRAELDRLDAASPGPGWTCFGGPTPEGSSAQQVGSLGAWVPGTSTVENVPGTATRIPRGALVVMQLHYNLQGGTDPDRTRVEVKYAPVGTGLQPVLTLPMRDGQLAIPPGSSRHVETASATAQSWTGGRFYPDGDAWVLGVAGHMHVLGRSFRIVKTSATASTTLLEIPAWDFHWQGLYQLVQPVRLLPGDQLSVECVYDNPGMSLVTWGEGTGEEMCIGYLQVVDNLPTE